MPSYRSPNPSGWLRRADDCHLELPSAEHRHRLLGLGLEDRELHLGVARAEQGHRRGHERGAGGREGRHPDTAAAEPGDRLQLSLGEGLLGEDRLGVTKQRIAGIGETHATGGPFEQRHARTALERRHLLGDGGLRVGERLGGCRQGAEAGDLAEDLQVPQLEHKHSLELAPAFPYLTLCRDRSHSEAMDQGGQMTLKSRPRLVGINHVALEVGDLEAALEFYGAIFEVRGVDREPGMAFIDMGDQFLALSQGRSQPPDRARHFGLVVDDKPAVRAASRREGSRSFPARGSTSSTPGATGSR